MAPILGRIGAIRMRLEGPCPVPPATLVVLPFMLRPARRADIRAVTPTSLRWFSGAGVLVCVSQMANYMALAFAPVSVVAPIHRLSLVFRIFVNTWLNRDHEVPGGRVWAATLIGLAGALLLTLPLT